MAQTGSNNKRDAYNELNLVLDYRCCPCCDYVGRYEESCDECPLINYWQGFFEENHMPCCFEMSPYREWLYADKEGRKIAAQKIIKLCNKAIKEEKQV